MICPELGSGFFSRDKWMMRGKKLICFDLTILLLLLALFEVWGPLFFFIHVMCFACLLGIISCFESFYFVSRVISI